MNVCCRICPTSGQDVADLRGEMSDLGEKCPTSGQDVSDHRGEMSKLMTGYAVNLAS